MELTVADTPIRQDARGRYCLNDLHRSAGEEHRHRPGYWLETQQTKELIAELEKAGIPAIHAKRGIGTFVVKELVYAYAMWINAAFCLKVIRTFDQAVLGSIDQARLRHEAASSFKVMNTILHEARKAIGKDTAAHHYMNEAKLVNSLMTGEYKSLPRDTLSTGELELLAHLEMRNAVLIGQGFSYDQRKTVLKSAALDWRMAHAPMQVEGDA